MKLDNVFTYDELKDNLKRSVRKIKKEHYTNYFIYAYNKEYYKNKEKRKSSKHRKLKIYKI
jgi:hypothetical protein